MAEIVGSIRRPRAWAAVVFLALVGGAMLGLAITVPPPPGYYSIGVVDTDPTPAATPFSELSERDQRAFLARLDGEQVRLDSPPDLEPNTVVEYEGDYYVVRVGHADPGWTPFHLVTTFGGFGLLGLAGLGGLVLLALLAWDRIAGVPA